MEFLDLFLVIGIRQVELVCQLDCLNSFQMHQKIYRKLVSQSGFQRVSQVKVEWDLHFSGIKKCINDNNSVNGKGTRHEQTRSTGKNSLSPPLHRPETRSRGPGGVKEKGGR